jgi:putative thioredoxin
MNPHVFDVDHGSFQAIVLDGSHAAPVLVDFWAPWCGPCRSLGPVLERLAADYAGRFILAKVNSDQEQELAARFGVRGIPNVKAFVRGEMVDEFTGALPESQVRRFIDALFPTPSEEARLAARDAAAGGDRAGARQWLATALERDPRNDVARIDLAELLLSDGDAAGAATALDDLHPLTEDNPRAAQLRARLRFATTGETQSAAALEARIASNPADVEARLDLAACLVNARQYEAALEQFLEVVRRDRKCRDDAARKGMLAVFSLIGGDHELTGRYRRQLASALH